MEPVRRILSIDGGGIKGAFPASLLSCVEDAIGDRVSNYFDLIIGTSTGGIIALGLGLGLTADEILLFYEELGPEIFRKRSFFTRLHHLFFAKYDDQPLRQALESKLGNQRLGESKNRLVIPSLNLDTGEAYLYKTAHHPKLERDYKQLAVTVGMATSAAPTYFPSHLATGGLALVDGGMWANNPTAIGVIEAIAILGWPAQSLRILSLGCTTSPVNVGRERQSPLGQLHWATRAVEFIMSAQSSSALGIAQVFIGEENLLRINPIAPTGRFTIDRVSEISALKGLGASEARKALPKLRNLFFTQHAEPFQPCHTLPLAK